MTNQPDATVLAGLTAEPTASLAAPGRLALANPDPRHAALRFDAVAHQYYIHDQPATSVSALYKRFFPEFDTARWAAHTATKRGCAPAEVAQEWADKATASATAGTTLHQQIEAFYNAADNDGGPAEAGPDFAHFLRFTRDYSHLVPYRTEWQVYHEELLLAGTIDFVAQNPDGTLSIYDWKRSLKVVDPLGQLLLNRYQTTEGPLNDLPDCPFSYYTLQQNIYKWLLETRYGCRVRDMQLVVVHPSYERYYVVPIPERPRHVERMVAALRAT